MRNPFTSSAIRRNTATVISTVAKHSHFIVQSSADAIAHTEGYLNSKLTAINAEQSVNHRRLSTKITQAAIQQRAAKLTNNLTSRFTAAE